MTRRAPAPLVSVVILNYNGNRHSGLWESYFIDDYPEKEIIFVDNGSRDESVSAFQNLARAYPGTRSSVVRIPDNVGFSEGHNRGYSQSSGEIVCLMSNDIAVEPGWMRRIVEALDSSERIAIAEPTLFNIRDRGQMDPMATSIDPFGHNYDFAPSGKSLDTVFYTDGAALCVKRHVVSQMGYLFPKDYFMMYEDVDICWRAKLLGYSSVVVSEARAFHVRGGTEPGVIMKRNPRIVERGTRNRLATLFTNYGFSCCLIFLPGSIALELAKSASLFVKGLKRESEAVCRGLLNFVVDLPSLKTRRRHIQASRVVPDGDILRQMESPLRTLPGLVSLWKVFVQRELSQ